MNKDFTDFLLSEYEHISSAHFEMAKQVSIFYRYYLTIVSAPAVIFLLLGKDTNSLNLLLQGEYIGVNQYIGYLFLIVGVVGFMICLYVINLKFNGILYAQTVNGIREYFYSSVSLTNESEVRRLPRDISKPNYFEIHFLPIVISFALINSSYLLLYLKVNKFVEEYSIFIAIVYCVVHILAYHWYSSYRKNKYLREN